METLAGERLAIEVAGRQRETRLQGHVDTLALEVAQLRAEMAPWPGRIDAQTETVRQARAVADEMREEVGRLERDQHELAETQRLWEGRIEGILAAQRGETEQVWRTFLTERGHDWQRLQADISARDERLAEIAGRVEELATNLAAVRGAVEDVAADQAAAVLGLRRQLLDLVTRWRDGTTEIALAIEADLPYDEQPTVREEQRQAQRRAMRAHRASHED
jgi:chromosome segregation ATPase